jgi:hypothetical protein
MFLRVVWRAKGSGTQAREAIVCDRQSAFDLWFSLTQTKNIAEIHAMGDAKCEPEKGLCGIIGCNPFVPLTPEEK